ncbi:MAG: hypothetical protein A2170_12975 [Deltaproteobacteria bacterium RBG_13_53_10]|nr:MAG: hypothetical protein A2170_12975 [Deltaproteobacteria bacterium RBG_13_53_10]
MEAQERGVPTLFVIPLIQFFVGCLLFVALLYGQRDLVILTLLVLGLVIGVKLWTRISLSGLKCRSAVDKQKLFPDERLTLRINAENKKFLPIWLQVIIPIRGLIHLPARDKILRKESSLLWFQRTRFLWELTAQRRGVHHIGPFHILAGDLFAFLTREKRMDESHQIIVYPRMVPLKPFSLPRRDFFGIPGARSPVQDPVYILGTRDYQHGQPAKYIHWKASARHNRLQEKVLESTQQEKVLLVVDASPFARHGAEEEFEQTLEVVASLAARLDRRGHAVGLITNCAVVGRSSSIVPMARNHQQLPTILEVLARIQLKPQGDLINVLRSGLTLAWGSSCVYFSYEEDATITVAQEYFRRCKAPAIFFVCRPRVSPEGEGFPVKRHLHRLEEIIFKKAEGR